MTHGDQRAGGARRVYSVLVVDDYEPWRRFICAEVQKDPRWRVIGEVSDGLEAVRAARALEPDLILLDIGLPGLNGLKAARRILAHRRDAQILFVTEQQSPDIAEAALEAGGRGYLVKVEAGRDLLFAMDAVVNGGRFLSPSLTPHVSETILETHDHAERRHEAAFYTDEASLLEGYTSFAERVLGAGNSLIIVSAESRRAAIQERLRARGVDIDGAVREERFFGMDPEQLLSAILVDGLPDEARFRKMGVPLLARATKAARGTPPRVAACGDCAPGLWRDGHVEAAIQMERLWDLIARECEMDLFCAFSVDVSSLHGEAYGQFQQLCAEHSRVRVG